MAEPRIPDISGLIPDLKVEFLLYELLKTGLDIDDVIINPLGNFRRRYRRDVAGMEIREYKDSNRQYLQLDINRNGIYDLLPKGLFHQPRNRKENLTRAQVIEEYNLQQEVEKEARLFFLPFEQELYRLALMLESEERESIFDVRNVLNNREFIRFWGIPGIFNGQQLCNLLYILPLVSFIVGDPHLTRLCFESILNDRVEIRASSPLDHEVTVADPAMLNVARVGVDFLVEHNYRDVSPCTDIFIYPAAREDLEAYLEGGTKKKMLDFLTGYFIPYENDLKVILVSGDQFMLAGEEGDSRLGISTNL